VLGLALDVMQGNETSATGVAIPGVDQQSLLQMVAEVLADVEVNVHGKFS
jgi:UTP:GlnB (protein PII) uridylyltransferase